MANEGPEVLAVLKQVLGPVARLWQLPDNPNASDLTALLAPSLVRLEVAVAWPTQWPIDVLTLCSGRCLHMLWQC